MEAKAEKMTLQNYKNKLKLIRIQTDKCVQRVFLLPQHLCILFEAESCESIQETKNIASFLLSRKQK